MLFVDVVCYILFVVYCLVIGDTHVTNVEHCDFLFYFQFRLSLLSIEEEQTLNKEEKK
jgi:hypothetical protein